MANKNNNGAAMGMADLMRTFGAPAPAAPAAAKTETEESDVYNWVRVSYNFRPETERMLRWRAYWDRCSCNDILQVLLDECFKAHEESDEERKAREEWEKRNPLRYTKKVKANK